MSHHQIMNGKWYVTHHSIRELEFVKFVSRTRVILSARTVFLTYNKKFDIGKAILREERPTRVNYNQCDFSRRFYVETLRPNILKLSSHVVNDRMSQFLDCLNFSGDLVYVN
jgi:hypothetical protein